MIVRANQPNCHRGYESDIDWTPTWIRPPKNGNHRADCRCMPGWKRRKTKAAMKWIEAKDAIWNEGRIIFYPSGRPCPAKRVLELAIYQASRNETYTACQRDGLNAREGTIHQRPKSTPC